MPARLNLTGQKFGRLTVLHACGFDPRKNSLWRVHCHCGGEVIVKGYRLRFGETRSCGCLQRESARKTGARNTTHGHRIHDVRSPTYESWSGMLARCYRMTHKRYADYGGRGIAVCPGWRQSFVKFIRDMGERPSGLTLDRKDNDGNYEPGNCRWATPRQQRHNRRDSKRVTSHPPDAPKNPRLP